jgi:ABC-type dipeptide/oligopeptide/nickel transport system permease subunit
MGTPEHNVDVTGPIGPGLIDAGAGLSAEEMPVRARGYWEQVWRRFRRDKLAIVGGLFVVFLILAAFIGGPLAAHWLGHGPNDQFITTALDANGQPVGPFTHVSDMLDPNKKVFLLLGADSTLGRDEFLRLLYGAQVSIEVAFFATFFSSLIGVTLGALAGYYRGWIDTVISRVTEVTMAFPFLLFAIALSSTVGQRMNTITFGFLGQGVFTLVVIFSLFGWFYPARIVRSVTMSLREKEFVEAARMVGASDLRIIRSHVLPHLIAPTIVISTLAVASFVLAEAGLSYLGLGIQLPTASWGNLLQSASLFYLEQPWLMVWPGLAVLATTLAFNLLGDGLRDAFDPRGTR